LGASSLAATALSWFCKLDTHGAGGGAHVFVSMARGVVGRRVAGTIFIFHSLIIVARSEIAWSCMSVELKKMFLNY
jgi:hypothetical protein